jgi:hypothetical protein
MCFLELPTTSHNSPLHEGSTLIMAFEALRTFQLRSASLQAMGFVFFLRARSPAPELGFRSRILRTLVTQGPLEQPESAVFAIVKESHLNVMKNAQECNRASHGCEASRFRVRILGVELQMYAMSTRGSSRNVNHWKVASFRIGTRLNPSHTGGGQ